MYRVASGRAAYWLAVVILALACEAANGQPLYHSFSPAREAFGLVNLHAGGGNGKDMSLPPAVALKLDRSCGYLAEDPDSPAFPTCGRPAKDMMYKIIDAVHEDAENGSAYDQFVLGMAYWCGDRAPLDPVRALKWLSLAARRGLDVAKNSRASLLQQLTPAEIASAERMVARWFRRHRAEN